MRGTERIRFETDALDLPRILSLRDCIRDHHIQTGTIVTGRRTFVIPNGRGGNNPLGVAFFVLTRDVPESVDEENTVGTFVSDGIESDMEQAAVSDKTSG